MLGFSSILTSIIQGLRVSELRLSTRFRKLLCVRVFFGMLKFGHNFDTHQKLTSETGNSTSSISPLVTFVVFVIIAKMTGRTLDAASAYTALSLISLLSTPMGVVVMTIPMLNAAMACFERIESFLKSDARRDHRLPLLESPSSSDEPSTTSLNNGIELKTLSSTIWQNDLSSALIVTQDASFAWSLTAPPAVSDLTLTLQRRQICFVIGPVGSGKSTLLKGLLGETPSSQGFVYSSSPETSFVDQT